VTAATPGRPARDLTAEEITREFAGWSEAQGYDDSELYSFAEMDEAFAAGMQAARDLGAQQPRPAPGHMMVMRGTIAIREAEIELLNRKLAEEKRIHRELLEAVLRHADNEADRDYPTPESRAQAYVELLEERNIELCSLIAEPQPAPELGADEVRETPGGAQ